jgi:hypothetical protein
VTLERIVLHNNNNNNNNNNSSADGIKSNIIQVMNQRLSQTCRESCRRGLVGTPWWCCIWWR